MAKISIPFNLSEPEENNLKLREVKAKEHLEKTSELTMSLSRDDIRGVTRYKNLEDFEKASDGEKNEKTIITK